MTSRPMSPEHSIDAQSRVTAEARPEFRFTRGQEHVAVRAGIQALAADSRVFQRTQTLVSIVRAADWGDRDISREVGAPVIAPLASARILEILSERMDWRKYDARCDEWLACAPPRDVVAAIYERKEWPGIRPLAGLVTCPVLRPDGTVLTREGYDPATGLVYVPTGAVPEVPDRPSRAEALAALELLLDAVADFPFAGDVDRATWLAALLSPLALPACDNAPLFIIDAPTPGTGKTLLADVIGIIATGKRMPRSPYVGRDRDDEMRKRITAHAIAGDSLILIDNVPAGQRVGWPCLDSALTGTEWSDRELTRSRIVRLPFRAVWFATGNNLGVQADAARRVLRMRLEAEDERPEERRGFRHEPLVPWLMANRSQLLGAALTILRAYLVGADRVAGLPSLGSFEGWSRVVRSAVVWLGMPDPVLASAARDPDIDPEREAHSQALLGWLEMDPRNYGLTAAEALDRLDSGNAAKLRDALAELCPTKDGSLPSSRALGGRLKALRDRPRRVLAEGGYRTLAFTTADADHRDGVRRWRVREMRDQAGSVLYPNSETGGQSFTGEREFTPRDPAHPAELFDAEGGVQ